MATYIPSEIHRVARTIDLAAPEAFRDKYHPTTAELNDMFDPITNPNGKIYRIGCALMNNFSFSVDAQTENALKACQQAASENVTGWDYGFTGTIRLDKHFDRFSANNFFRELTLEPDRHFILIDRIKYGGDEKSFAEVTDWIQFYEFTTDVQNHILQNGEFAAISFEPLSSGSLWQDDLVIDIPGGHLPNYLETEEFITNENIDYINGIRGYITNKYFPDAAEVNTGINVVDITPFSNTTIPHAIASETDNNPTINQNAQVQRRSTGNYEGTAGVLYPKEPLTDTQKLQVAYANLIRGELVKQTSVVRIAQSPTSDRSPVKAGDFVNVFDFKNSWPNRPQPDGESYRIENPLLTDGFAKINTIAIDGTTPTENIVVTSAGSVTTLTVGKSLSLFARLYGHNITYGADWSVDDSSIGTVSELGILTGKGAGSVVVTAAHPSGVSATITITVSAATQAVVTSANAPVTGGLATIVGTDLDTVATITVDGDVVDWWGATTDGTTITLQVPAHAAGTVPVILDGYWGTTAVTDSLTYA